MTARRGLGIVLGFVLVVGIGVVVYWYAIRKPQPPSLPAPGDPAYEAYVSAFQIGTAQLDAGLILEAEQNLTQATTLIPGEPAAWANRAILYMRQGNRLKQAAADLAQAQALAPGNPEIEEIAGFLAEAEDRLPEAKEHFQKASAADPTNVRRLYMIGNVIAKEAKPDADAERFKILDQLLLLQPEYLPVLSESAFLASRTEDVPRLERTIANLTKLSKNWHENTQKQLELVREGLAKPNFDTLPDQLRILGNLLLQEDGFAAQLEQLSPKESKVGTTLQAFVKLAPTPSAPDPADLGISFQPQQPKTADYTNRIWLGVIPVWLDATQFPALLAYDANEILRIDRLEPALRFPLGPKKIPPTLHSIVGLDWDNDQRTDFVIALASGLSFYHQNPNGTFEAVTATTKLPEDLLRGDYFGAWAVDIDFDGDMDILLAPNKGEPLLVRNNFDRSFTKLPIFPGVQGLREFAWLDLDHDGAADAAMLDEQGQLHVFMNQRSGKFTRREVPEPTQTYHALAVADVNDDGILDLIALRTDGTLLRLSDRNQGTNWEVAMLGRTDLKNPLKPGACRLQALDLDNNGAIDLVFRTPLGGVAWLANGKGTFELLPLPIAPGVADCLDLDGDGMANIVALDREGHIRVEKVVGSRGYHWFDAKPRSLNAVGDNRVNTFGLGGEMELRTGILVTKQPIEAPTVHFGLGNRSRVDLLRIQWPNGTYQHEFEKPSGAAVVIGQRLKGSCPFLFTWDGESMVFVNDFCWSTPLGMYINGQDKGGFLQTTDWIKIRGDRLVPKDGQYDLRINANLWETHFLDELGLMAVDHPPDTELYLDERFFLQPTKPRLYLTETSRPIAQAWDHHGEDVTAIVQTVDGNYLDRAGRGKYQGITNDHWVEIELGDNAPTTGPVYLLASGWIHPTDSSINYALAQSDTIKPMPLTLEIPDGKGGWKVGQGGLGFPAGKNKTCVIRLDGIEGNKVTRRFRIRTNLEIYWDAFRFAKGLDASQCQSQRLQATSAELQYRGILEMTQANAGSPELPHYDRVISRSQVWRDLIGFHTRFGDVRELIEKTDDRYVIMNAGDELRLTFPVPATPRQGWIRDFVWISDGWVKDGDLNTRWGKTVLPLPYHSMKSYETPPGRLEDEPAFRKDDWLNYHTRYVSPYQFEQGLRSFRTSPRLPQEIQR